MGQEAGQKVEPVDGWNVAAPSTMLTAAASAVDGR